MLGLGKAFWQERKYHLDRMSLRDLSVAYVQYPAIQVYAVLLAISTVAALAMGETPLRARMGELTLAVVVAVLAYPLVWHLLHRYVLHGRFLYRSPYTAALWKRIHYDHHRDPHDLRVLFGALHTTLPTIAVVTLPIGALIGGPPAAAAAFAAGLATTLFYEYCHCIQHLNYTPKTPWLREIKRLHLLHHFHNEQGNYGITNYLWDRLTGTYYRHKGQRPYSPTVFNLGYDEHEAARYPWVAQLSQGEGGQQTSS